MQMAQRLLHRLANSAARKLLRARKYVLETGQLAASSPFNEPDPQFRKVLKWACMLAAVLDELERERV